MTAVIGVDLSLTATGLSDGSRTWLIRSSGKKADDLPTRAARLSDLRGAVVLACASADLVMIEQPAFASQTGHMHDRSGLWWQIVADLFDLNRAVVEVAPTALKKYATGKGNANKGAVIDATARRFPTIDTGADDNRCDALWLAQMGLDYLTGNSPVPAAQRAVLSNIRWPANLRAAA